MSVPFLQSDHLERLAQKMRRGNKQAAEKLYSELVDKVFAFCVSRLRNREEAEDVAQEIFLKLVDRIDSFDVKRGHFVGWFWTLARNTLIDHTRGRKKIASPFTDMSDREGAFENEIAYAAIHEETFDIKEEYNAVLQFLKTLPKEEQELFEMRFIADMPYKEIAELTKRSEGALRVSVNRLKAKIKSGYVV